MCKTIILSNHTVPSLIKYSYSIFRYLHRSLGITQKVYLFPLLVPFSNTNGFTVSIGRKNHSMDIICVNLWPFRKTPKTTTAMTSFYLFSVIAHELQHIRILQDWYAGKTNDFGVIFSEWAVAHLRRKEIFGRLVHFYFSAKGTSSLRKRRYDVSPVELICYQYGFQTSYNYHEHLLSSQELNIAKTILRSIEFINQHIEIDYYTSKQAYNRFTHAIYYIQKALYHHPEYIHNYPQLTCIFSQNGFLKSPTQIFAERNPQNEYLCDQILIRMFISLSFDWQNIFQNNFQLYNHMCRLVNNYCTDSINFLKDIIVGRVFLSESILQDNAAMRIKNVTTLNQLILTYHMPRTSGSVFPLYYSDDFTNSI